jgi:hypothetical protein
VGFRDFSLVSYFSLHALVQLGGNKPTISKLEKISLPWIVLKNTYLPPITPPS